ncbi:MAG: transcription termination/antitermination protein NusG [Pirellulaceae bacterium]
MATDPERRDEIASQESLDAPVADESGTAAAPTRESDALKETDDDTAAEHEALTANEQDLIQAASADTSPEAEQSGDQAPGDDESLGVDESLGDDDESLGDDEEDTAADEEEEQEEQEEVEEAEPEVAPQAGHSEAEVEEEENIQRWYILKVQVNREESIRRALERRVKIAGLERFFGEIVVPTEDVAEYNKSGKRRIVKKKLYPGYLMIHLALNDDTWFLVRETPGIGDFTGSAGKPTPMADHEVQRIVVASKGVEAGESPVKTAIPFKSGDRVRVKEGYFENFEGDVDAIDEANGRVTVMINIFGRSTPVELEHWQMESI